MCHLLTTYHCAHTQLDTRYHCKDYHHRYNLAKRQQSLGIFSCFFPSPRICIICSIPRETRIILDLCPKCKLAKVCADTQLEAQKAREAQDSQNWEKIRDQQVVKARQEKERAAYRCQLCIAEGRRPDERNRAANGGLCCARGLAEFADLNKTKIPRPRDGSSRREVERERIRQEGIPRPQTGVSRIPMQQRESMRGAQKTLPQKPMSQQQLPQKPLPQKPLPPKPLPQKPLSQPPRTRPSARQPEMRQVEKQTVPQWQASSSQKATRREQKSDKPRELRRVKSREKLRSDARKAADGYGWDRQQKDSTYLEPNLIKQYINTPGADPRTIGSGPPIPEPLYEEPAIDWNQWIAAKQGSHGRLPPGMPEGPLPIRPLKTRRGKTVPSISHKPVPIRKPDGMRELRVDPVSPLLSPMKSNPSPVSPSAITEELMSDLDEHLVDAMHSWTPIPIAAPPPVFRNVQWR